MAMRIADSYVSRTALLSRYQMPGVIPVADLIRILNEAKIRFVLVGAYGLAQWRKESRGKGAPVKLQLQRSAPIVVPLIVFAGIAAGFAHMFGLYWLASLPIYVGVCLASATIFAILWRLPPKESRPEIEVFGALGLIAYVVFEYTRDWDESSVPLLNDWNGNVGEGIETNVRYVIAPAILLLPLVIGGLRLPRYGTGLGALAVWSVLFSRVVLFCNNCCGQRLYISWFHGMYYIAT